MVPRETSFPAIFHSISNTPVLLLNKIWRGDSRTIGFNSGTTGLPMLGGRRRCRLSYLNLSRMLTTLLRDLWTQAPHTMRLHQKLGIVGRGGESQGSIKHNWQQSLRGEKMLEVPK